MTIVITSQVKQEWGVHESRSKVRQGWGKVMARCTVAVMTALLLLLLLSHCRLSKCGGRVQVRVRPGK